MRNADGMKTGHTEEAGFSLTATVKRGDRRLIEAMGGMKSNKERSEEAEKLINWGFREFDNYKILEQGQMVAEVPVWMGKEDNVGLIVNEDVVKTIARGKVIDTKMTVVFDKPVRAPIKKGDQLGIVKVEIPDREKFDVPLYADKDVDEAEEEMEIKDPLKEFRDALSGTVMYNRFLQDNELFRIFNQHGGIQENGVKEQDGKLEITYKDGVTIIFEKNKDGTLTQIG